LKNDRSRFFVAVVFEYPREFGAGLGIWLFFALTDAAGDRLKTRQLSHLAGK